MGVDQLSLSWGKVEGHYFSVACLERVVGLGEWGDSAKEDKLP